MGLAYLAIFLGNNCQQTLIVAENADLAKQRGKAHFAEHWQKSHTDRVLEVDDCLPIDCVEGRYIRLIQGSFFTNRWENTYLCVS